MRRVTLTTGRLAAAALLFVWASEVPAQRVPPAAEPAVLGTKLARCATDDGSLEVAPGIRRLRAENAPLTVTVSGGEIAAVLTSPLKITRGSSSPTPTPASFRIGAPRAAGGALTVAVTVRNLTDCAARVSLAHGLVRRGEEPFVVSAVRFGDRDDVVLPAGGRATGSFSAPMEGDGRYEIDVSAYADIGLVR